MTTLSTWKFDTPGGAERALRTLSRLQTDRLVTVQDAAVVSWPEGRRKPRAWQARDIVGPAALSGAFWGLLFGILFLLPLAGLALGAAAGIAAGAFGHVGMPDAFLQRVRDEVTPGTSALFLLTSDEVVDRVADAFAGTHAQLLVSNLSRAQEAALRHAFDDGDDDGEDSAVPRPTDPAFVPRPVRPVDRAGGAAEASSSVTGREPQPTGEERAS